MSEELSFVQLMALVRSGDSRAVEQIMSRYGAAVLRTARMRMFNSRLRQAFDSEDIAQSVMKSFLLRIADDGNQWQIDSPGDLTNLLVSMTENKVVDKIRHETAQRRGGTAARQPLDSAAEITGRVPPPDEIASLKEEAQRCWNLLHDEARALYRMRYEADLSWTEIGALLGSTAEASRKRLERILAEVGRRISGNSP